MSLNLFLTFNFKLDIARFAKSGLKNGLCLNSRILRTACSKWLTL